MGRKVPDGAYRTMLERLNSPRPPSLILMRYDAVEPGVTDLIVAPRRFFTPSLIEPRKPLALTARRAGWQGCNIVIGDLPEAGRIWLVRDREPTSRAHVLEAWRRTAFLDGRRREARGWAVEVMKSVERIGRPEFTLAEVYADLPRLTALYPGNRHPEEKVRQQLQVLRDAGWLRFEGRGRYRLVAEAR